MSELNAVSVLAGMAIGFTASTAVTLILSVLLFPANSEGVTKASGMVMVLLALSCAFVIAGLIVQGVKA